MLAVSQGNGGHEGLPENTADIAAQNFIEITVEDAKIEGAMEENSNKLSLSFFLIRLLNEFRNQDVGQAVD